MRSLPPSTDMKSDTLRSALPAFHLPFSSGTPKKHVITTILLRVNAQFARASGLYFTHFPFVLCFSMQLLTSCYTEVMQKYFAG